MEALTQSSGSRLAQQKEEEADTRQQKAIPAQSASTEAATRIALFPEEGDLLLLEISPILLVNQHEV